MNDDDVTFEIGYSPDSLIKGSGDAVMPDYSFRMVKTTQYTRLKAKIRNGVVETEQVADLRLPDFAWFPAMSDEADFHRGRVRLVIGPGGNASGLVGGYRDWRQLYAKDTWNQGQYEPTSATTREVFNHDNRIAMYYALKRNADAMPDPKTGCNTAISIAYRFTAKRAYVVDPAVPAQVKPWVPTEVKRRAIATLYRGLFMKGVTTKAIQQGPVGPKRKGRNAKTVAAPSGPRAVQKADGASAPQPGPGG